MSYRSTSGIVHYYSTYRQPVTALAFDPVSDTLWVGMSSGQVAAFHSNRQRSVFFRAGGPVTKIVPSETHVRAISTDSAEKTAGVGAWSKGAVNKWFRKYALLFLRSTRP